MMRGHLLLAASALATTPVHAAAERPDRGHGIFFNQPGATLERMIAERQACEAIASGTATRFSPVPVPNLVGILTAGILSGIAAGRQRRVNTENCMVIRGWRLYAFTRSEGAAWKALAPAVQASELTQLVGAEKPARGALLRRWANEYAEPVFWQKD